MIQYYINNDVFIMVELKTKDIKDNALRTIMFTRTLDELVQKRMNE